MSDKNVEKSFLYLVTLSVLLHLTIFWLVTLIPPEKVKSEPEPTMVDLTELPEPPAKPPRPSARLAERPQRSASASAPKAPRTERPQEPAPANQLRPSRAEARPANPSTPNRMEQPGGAPLESGGKVPVTRGEGIFKPKSGEALDRSRLFPSAGKMAHLEESFRKKYLEEEQGDTRLMDTDDPDIGSFTRRYVIAVKDQLNAIDRYERKGLGMTVLNITIKRDGTIDGIRILYSSGNKQLDELATKASRTASYVGPLPKRWDHNVLNLICSFIVQEGGLVSTRWESN
jgi:protein TonB